MNRPPSPPQSTRSEVTTPGSAVASLVLGILSLGASIITGIPAVNCGHIALSKNKKLGSKQGSGMAVAGLVLGYLSLLAIPVFIGIVYAGSSAALKGARNVQVTNTALTLKMAMSAYQDEYRRAYPALPADGNTVETNDKFMGGLLGADAESAKTSNPRGIVFFHGKPARSINDGRWRNGINLDSTGSGSLWDPWGHLYRVKRDSNDRIQVWSIGPDGMENSEDDVKTID